MEAIVAATRRPAERLGRRDVFGTIAPGRAADLLLGWPPIHSPTSGTSDGSSG